MSSREQYRELLKREKQISAKLKIDNAILIKSYEEALKKVNQLERQLAELKAAGIKKWWQFWK